jgi:pimeloyl-ACP methyl ester carboxylesterase
LKVPNETHFSRVSATANFQATTLLFVPGWPGLPSDNLSLGPLLAEQGINFCWFNPRGLPPSEGFATFAGTLQDIGAALQWMRRPEVQKRFNIDTTRIVLGGYSFGGGMAMAYAARDPSIRRVILIAGMDFGELVREMQRNAAFAEGISQWLLSTCEPDGPARFDMEAELKELVDHPDMYGLRENAVNMVDRSILLFGGWEDEGTSVEQHQLPLYRALRNAGAANVTFLVYHTNHDFSNVRQQLASDIADWLLRERSD